MTVLPRVVAPLVAGGAAAIGWLATRGGDESEDADDGNWECVRCGTVSVTNPDECDVCGHTAFDWSPDRPGPGGTELDDRDEWAVRPAGSVVDRILRAVTEREGVRPMGLDPPLFDAVDPDTLEAFVRSAESGWVTFEYLGYEVTVTADGGIRRGDGLNAARSMGPPSMDGRAHAASGSGSESRSSRRRPSA